MFYLIFRDEVAQVSEKPFDVAPDFKWVEAPEGAAYRDYSYKEGVFAVPIKTESFIFKKTLYEQAIELLIKYAKIDDPLDVAKLDDIKKVLEIK